MAVEGGAEDDCVLVFGVLRTSDNGNASAFGGSKESLGREDKAVVSSLESEFEVLEILKVARL